MTKCVFGRMAVAMHLCFGVTLGLAICPDVTVAGSTFEAVADDEKIIRAPKGNPKYVCKRKGRKCAEYQDGRCVRYENKFDCWFPDPQANRCDPAANAINGIHGCTVTGTNCKQMNSLGQHCQDLETQLRCDIALSGEGVTALDPEVAVTYEQVMDGVLEAGCRVTNERCVDSAPRDVAVSNWPGHTVTANPVCWEKAIDVSCPSDTNASACQTLEAAGCIKENGRTCEEMRDGVCVKWSSSYRCRGFEIKGPNIQTDQVIDWTN